MARVVITGASGFIGRHVAAALQSNGHTVIPTDRGNGDVAERETWARLPESDVVIHLAGRSFVPESWAEPAAFLRINVQGSVEALEYARTAGARVVFVSSYLYGPPDRLPIAESTPVVATNPYALSKALAEQACRFFAERFGVKAAILRPFNVYGPGQDDVFLIPMIARQIHEGNAIRVKDLDPRRDYVYVSDVANAIVRAAEATDEFGIFNVGSGQSHSVREIIDIMQSLAGTTLSVQSADERRRDEIMDSVADISLARERLGWTPQWSLRDGLEATLRETSRSYSRSP